MADKKPACSFTGHRAAKLPWGFNEQDPRCVQLKQQIYDAIDAIYDSGIRHFICGMANGCDMYFGEAVLELFPHLRPVEKQQITDYVPSIPNLDTDAMDDASYPQARLYPHFLKRSLIAEAQEALDAQLQVSGVCDADIVNVGAYQLCMYCPHNATCPYGKHDQREDE